MRNLWYRRDRGSVLLLTMFILILLALLGTGFMYLIPVEMRNAQHDRTAVQTGYGADGALLVVMNELQAGTPYDQISTAPQSLQGGWEYKVEQIEQLAAEEFRVTTAGLLRGKTKRRAVAIIDDGSGEYAISFNSDGVNATQTINSQGAWPTSVPIKGDVFVQGTWYVNNQGFDMSNPNPTPPFEGTVFQTDPSGGALRGEKYNGTNPTNASEYATLYTNGFDAIQPFNTASIAQEDLILQDQVRQDLLSKTFGISNGSAAETAANAINTAGVHVPLSGGAMAGGVYIEPGNSDSFSVVFSVDAQGNSLMTVTNDGTISEITFITEGGNYGGSSVPNNQDKLYVVTTVGAGGSTGGNGSGGGNGNGGGGSGGNGGGGSGGNGGGGNGGNGGGGNGGNGGGGNSGSGGTTGGTTSGSTGGTTGGTTGTGVFYDGNFSEGNVVYIDGDVDSIQGTHKGNHTIAAKGAMTITGELLKSDTPRGQEPTAASTDTLGLVAVLDAGNSSPGMSIDMQGTPPPDDEYFVYAYVTALSKTDGNAKMFSNNQHPDLPNGTTLSLIGSMVWAPTTPGHINTAMSFIEEGWKQVILDPQRPIGFPGKSSFVPRVRSYVDIPVGE